jgi:hypothetical protein
MNVLPESPPVFLVLDDSDGVRHLVARAMGRLLPGAIIVEAACNREASEILSSRKVSGIIEDFQRCGEDAVDLDLALLDQGIERPGVILYTGTDFVRVERAFQGRGLTMSGRFSAVVPKVDLDALCEHVRSVFPDRGWANPAGLR